MGEEEEKGEVGWRADDDNGMGAVKTAAGRRHRRRWHSVNQICCRRARGRRDL